jgi:hypothetical protein
MANIEAKDLEQYFESSELLDRKMARIDKLFNLIKRLISVHLERNLPGGAVRIASFELPGTEDVLVFRKAMYSRNYIYGLFISVGSFNSNQELIVSYDLENNRPPAEYVKLIYNILPVVVNHFKALLPTLGDEIERIKAFAA